MNEVESVAAASRKREFMLWPSIVQLVLLFWSWIFIYHDIVWFLLVLVMDLFFAVCLICFLYQVVLRRLRRSLSFLTPVLLAVLTGFLFILPIAPVAEPMITVGAPARAALFHSRDYVEFLMYNARHNIKAEVRQSGCRYKKWILLKHSGTSYQIIYDAADKIVEEDDTERGGCYISVDRVGEHFYFLRGECG